MIIFKLIKINDPESKECTFLFFNIPGMEWNTEQHLCESPDYDGMPQTKVWRSLFLRMHWHKRFAIQRGKWALQHVQHVPSQEVGGLS